jgi:hypothetical protein
VEISGSGGDPDKYTVVRVVTPTIKNVTPATIELIIVVLGV